MTEIITTEQSNADAWVCICGNTPSAAGFYPIDAEDREVEPTPSKWSADQYFCNGCGRVIDQHTLVVDRHPQLASIVRLP